MLEHNSPIADICRSPALIPKCTGRKGHKKSRTGCQNCKVRKIKCDERRPECRKCEVYGVECTYDKSLALQLKARRETTSQSPSSVPTSISISSVTFAAIGTALGSGTYDKYSSNYLSKHFSLASIETLDFFQKYTMETIATSSEILNLYQEYLMPLAISVSMLSSKDNPELTCNRSARTSCTQS